MGDSWESSGINSLQRTIDFMSQHIQRVEEQERQREFEKDRERFAASDRQQSFLLGYWDGQGSELNSMGSPSYLAGWVAGRNDIRLKELESRLPRYDPLKEFIERYGTPRLELHSPRTVSKSSSYYWPRSDKGNLIAGLILVSSPFLFAMGIGIYYGIKKLFE